VSVLSLPTPEQNSGKTLTHHDGLAIDNGHKSKATYYSYYENDGIRHRDKQAVTVK
jgi:hypothetical protein